MSTNPVRQCRRLKHIVFLAPARALARLENVTLSARAAFRTLEASITLLRRAIDIVRNMSDGPSPSR